MQCLTLINKNKSDFEALSFQHTFLALFIRGEGAVNQYETLQQDSDQAKKMWLWIYNI